LSSFDYDKNRREPIMFEFIAGDDLNFYLKVAKVLII